MMMIFEQNERKKDNNFKKKLKECRRYANIDQESLSELCKLSISTIKKWESGATRPTPCHMTILSKILSERIPNDMLKELTEAYSQG